MENNFAIGDAVHTRYGYGIVSRVSDEAIKVELDERMWSWFLDGDVTRLAEAVSQ
jgi:preprotein translocase subunit YajC